MVINSGGGGNDSGTMVVKGPAGGAKSNVGSLLRDVDEGSGTMVIKSAAGGSAGTVNLRMYLMLMWEM